MLTTTTRVSASRHIHRRPPHGLLTPCSCLPLVLLLQWSHSKNVPQFNFRIVQWSRTPQFTPGPGVHGRPVALEIDSSKESPNALPGRVDTRGEANHARIRWLIFLHLIAVGICLALTLADRGLLVSKDISRFFFHYCYVLFPLSAIAWWVCPIMMAITLARPGVARDIRIRSVIAETILCVAQVYVLLPSVM